MMNQTARLIEGVPFELLGVDITVHQESSTLCACEKCRKDKPKCIDVPVESKTYHGNFLLRRYVLEMFTVMIGDITYIYYKYTDKPESKLEGLELLYIELHKRLADMKPLEPKTPEESSYIQALLHIIDETKVHLSKLT